MTSTATTSTPAEAVRKAAAAKAVETRRRNADAKAAADASTAEQTTGDAETDAIIAQYAHITSASPSSDRHAAVREMHATGRFTYVRIAQLVGYANGGVVGNLLTGRDRRRPPTKPTPYSRGVAFIALNDADADTYSITVQVLAAAFNRDETVVFADVLQARETHAA